MRIIALVVLLTAVPARAQHESEPAEHELESKNELGIFLGAISNLDAGETGPSVGVEYTRELNETFGIGLLAEFARAGEREALVAASFVVRPTAEIKLIVAPGLVVEKPLDEHASDEPSEAGRAPGFLARLGIGYEVELSRFSLAPTLYFDLLEGTEGGTTAHLVYGVSIGFPF